ncbi:MAG: DUF6526 family protein [Ignavibacteria bacterium]
MKDQNYGNHVRFVKGYHFITLPFIILLLGVSIYSLINSSGNSNDMRYSLMFLITSGILISMLLYSRSFSLKAQDRAIRAEENLRFYLQTGKLFDPELKLSQILALRFAPDIEFMELYKKSLTENLSPLEIKKSIKNWKADNHRV